MDFHIMRTGNLGKYFEVLVAESLIDVHNEIEADDNDNSPININNNRRYNCLDLEEDDDYMGKGDKDMSLFYGFIHFLAFFAVPLFIKFLETCIAQLAVFVSLIMYAFLSILYAVISSVFLHLRGIVRIVSVIIYVI